MTRQEIVYLWNAKTDDSRLWYELGEDEKLAWAMTLEREACAKVCEARYMGDNNREDMEARRCAAAIRARGNT